MMSGETIWAGLGVMTIGDASPLHASAPPDNAITDYDISEFDAGDGWNQGVTMDRQPVDRATQSLASLAPPIGIPVRPDSVYLNLERNQTHSAEQMAPQLRGEQLGDRFDSYVNLIEWCPYPAVIHSRGLESPVREQGLVEYAKQGVDQNYYFGVIDGQALLDEAISRTRKAMYGR